MGPCLGATREYLDRLIEAGTDATGIQLSARVLGAEPIDVAVGHTLGVPMDVHHLHPAYCAAKPLLGLACGILIDRGELDLDTQVPLAASDDGHGSGFEVGPSGTAATVRSLLNHSAGLVSPTGIEWRICPPAERAGLFRPAVAPGPAYSEVYAGTLLERVVEQTSGLTATTFLERHVLDPLGIGDDLLIGAARATEPATRARTAVPYSGLPDRPLPMLSERIPCQLAEIRPALGALASAWGLVRLYASIGSVLSGTEIGGLPSPRTLHALLAAGRGRRSDALLGRVCDFSGGFMISLQDHGFGHAVSDRAFGHVGGMGHTIAMCDPTAAGGRGVAVAGYLNGCEVGLGDAAAGVRSTLIDLVLTDLA